MAEQWEAHGPDDFGDFTISAKGEQLAKCVVVQNGFRSPQETKAIAERLIQAVNCHEVLVKVLEGIAEFSSGDDTKLGALSRLASIRNSALTILAHVSGSGNGGSDAA